MTGASFPDRWPTRRARWRNVWAARTAGWGPSAREFAVQPEPRSIGSHARGRQILGGNLLFAGHLIEAPGAVLWEVAPPSAAFRDECHGGAWLDDLAAASHSGARKLAQDWVFGWIDRFGRGIGPGWTPELAARRLIRWINHAPFLLAGREAADKDRLFRSLTQQTVYLSRMWSAAPEGLPRLEALTGLISAGLALAGMERHADPAIEALARECDASIDHDGGIPTRNPEELLEALTLLTWAKAALTEAGRDVPRALTEALERVVPTLRALRHSDGGLARFHGGGRGQDGRLDAALAASGIRTPARTGLAMGFARLSAARTTVIVDAAPPPIRAASMNAHASALALELTSGRRPLIVNCGSGLTFGADWRRAGRATPSHSTLCIEGFSSGRLGPREQGGEPLVEGPGDVWVDRGEGGGEHRLALSHDAWVATHGLTCFRELALTDDGRALNGEDSLTAVSPEERRMFDYAMDEVKSGGIPYQVRFHLHPDADPELDLGGTAVSVALRSGEMWIFRHDGTGELSLEPSVYLESGRLKPRPTQAIVLSARVLDYTGSVSWTLAKALDTPSNLRDLEMAAPQADP
ncbi:MAG: heparinase II/III family protein [Rhodobacteraceae bacterium]|jgi:uncharacterized heparinase superfamily protein|nr:heparinase II/III family protein [Paracoccaceae bacterium]